MTDDQQTDGFRTEHDSMGDVRVPLHAKWRAQTQRAVENFPSRDSGWSGPTSGPSPGSRPRRPS